MRDRSVRQHARNGLRSASVDEQSEHERQSPRHTIVIPCLNERANLPELRRRLSATLEQLAEPYEVIVVDDGSTDGSVEYVERWIDDDPTSC